MTPLSDSKTLAVIALLGQTPGVITETIDTLLKELFYHEGPPPLIRPRPYKGHHISNIHVYIPYTEGAIKAGCLKRVGSTFATSGLMSALAGEKGARHDLTADDDVPACFIKGYGALLDRNMEDHCLGKDPFIDDPVLKAFYTNNLFIHVLPVLSGTTTGRTLVQDMGSSEDIIAYKHFFLGLSFLLHAQANTIVHLALSGGRNHMIRAASHAEQWFPFEGGVSQVFPKDGEEPAPHELHAEAEFVEDTETVVKFPRAIVEDLFDRIGLLENYRDMATDLTAMDISTSEGLSSFYGSTHESAMLYNKLFDQAGQVGEKGETENELEVIRQRINAENPDVYLGKWVLADGSNRLLRVKEKGWPQEGGFLITGETSVGKEVVARLLHRLSERTSNPFVVVNCPAIPENLFESELFGHEKGVFTGADSKKTGLVEAADGGTLFLDEIGDMPLEHQAKILRLIREHTYRPVGSTTEKEADLQIICATNVSLEEAVKKKQFRRDLFFRINTFEIPIPPLRERKDEIIPLARLFWNKQVFPFDRSAKALLTDYQYPGNIAELKSVIAKISYDKQDNSAVTREDLMRSGGIPDSSMERDNGLPEDVMTTYHRFLGDSSREENICFQFNTSWQPFFEAFARRTSGRASHVYSAEEIDNLDYADDCKDVPIKLMILAMNSKPNWSQLGDVFGQNNIQCRVQPKFMADSPLHKYDKNYISKIATRIKEKSSL